MSGRAACAIVSVQQLGSGACAPNTCYVVNCLSAQLSTAGLKICMQPNRKFVFGCDAGTRV